MPRAHTQTPEIAKILVASLVLGASISIPIWYWNENEYIEANCRQGDAQNSELQTGSSISGGVPIQNLSPSRKDTRAYKEIDYPEWGILVVTGIYALFSYRQWKATQKAAEAADRNSQALINSDRAWVHVDLFNPPPVMTTYILKAWNYGKTPAEIIGLLAERHFIDPGDGEISRLPQAPYREMHGEEMHRFIVPSAPEDLERVKDGLGGFRGGEMIYTFDVAVEFGKRWAELRDGTKDGVLAFTLEYRDVIDRSRIRSSKVAYLFDRHLGRLTILEQLTDYT